MTAWMVVTVVSKSSTSCEIDTFITDWSRTIRNCAPDRTTRTDHFDFEVTRESEAHQGEPQTPQLTSGSPYTSRPWMMIRQSANTPKDQKGNAPPTASSDSTAPMVAAVIPMIRPYGRPLISEKPPVSWKIPRISVIQPHVCRLETTYCVLLA